LWASIIAFLVALNAGFFLQKLFTFREYSKHRSLQQFFLYTALALCNLAMNTLIVYVLVEYAGVHYLVAQTIGASSVAFVSYFIYRLYIFADTL